MNVMWTENRLNGNYSTPYRPTFADQDNFIEFGKKSKSESESSHA